MLSIILAGMRATRVIHDTLRVFLHDTVVVKDTVIRVAAATKNETPAWLLALVTASAAVVAGVLAQGYRALLTDNRKREQVRQVLMLEVRLLMEHLSKIQTLAWIR